MRNVGCRIIKDFDRPSTEVVEKFRELPVANIDDCMSRTSAFPENIRPLNKAKLLGPAFTVRVPDGDNLMFHKAMDLAKPGDVIVIDAGGATDRAILGEIMSTYCKVRGVAGIVLNGCVRDRDEIGEMDFPVYAVGATPNGPYKNGPGEINSPIAIGGNVIFPGDIIIGDGDGVIAIKPADAEAILELTYKVGEKEANIMKVMDEEKTYFRSWVDEKLKEINCEILDK